MNYDPAEHHRQSIRLRGYDYRQAGAYFVTVCTQNRECALGEVVDGEMVLNEPGRMAETVWRELPQHYPGVEVDAFVVMPNHVHGIIMLVGAGPRACPDDAGQPQGVAPTEAMLVGAGPRACPDNAGQPEGVAPTGTVLVGAGPRTCPDDGGQPQGVAPTGTVLVGAGSRACPDNPGRSRGVAGQPQGVAPTEATSLPNVVHRLKSLTTARYRRGVLQGRWLPFPGRLWQRNYYEHVVRNEEEPNAIRQYIADNPARWEEDSENPDAVVADVGTLREAPLRDSSCPTP